MSKLPERYREMRNLLIGAKERDDHVIIGTQEDIDTLSNKLTDIHGKVTDIGKDYVIIKSGGTRIHVDIINIRCVYFDD